MGKRSNPCRVVGFPHAGELVDPVEQTFKVRKKLQRLKQILKEVLFWKGLLQLFGWFWPSVFLAGAAMISAAVSAWNSVHGFLQLPQLLVWVGSFLIIVAIIGTVARAIVFLNAPDIQIEYIDATFGDYLEFQNTGNAAAINLQLETLLDGWRLEVQAPTSLAAGERKKCPMKLWEEYAQDDERPSTFKECLVVLPMRKEHLSIAVTFERSINSTKLRREFDVEFGQRVRIEQEFPILFRPQSLQISN